ncbi:protein glutamate methyltransferase CheR associated with MCPs of class 40H [Geotalea daltonii FRC-32]|uniref:protein-glutamate O-methyltransferase n=1 Tax=Geotalea daltonii (strain DSM 22248 / JCM 15807 / FRC-32) TaxID=316067 RepID=B9M9E8_GEODF|nr:protein-glutamate O-methyltransferase CheR [Geotalea daltonii]ACM20520.1 protein glutamate methyltransferase CheR associated with MCPs of class 40H [Geotalea daltonii FRC-32]
MFYSDPEVQMTDEEFRLIRDLIYTHCGLYFDNDSKYLLEKRLGRRLSQHQIKEFRDYYHLLKYDRNRDQELSDIMDVLTTNETYFFREAFQLKAFTSEIVPELMAAKEKKGDRSLRIWSAGCSTGEEPYTIAMLLLELGVLKDWRVEIVGTDISQRVLHQARKATYGKTSFRSTDETYINRFFQEQDGLCKINDEVRELVTISHLNLFDHNRLALLGKMDVIFCRNVIIYFDQIAKKKVVESFYKVLRDGGYLLLGHSESLMNISTAFALKHLKNDMVYQKPPTAGTGVFA